MELSLDTDILRIEDHWNEDTESILIDVRTDRETVAVAMRQSDNIHDAVVRGLGVEKRKIDTIMFYGAPVYSSGRVADLGLEAGAKLSVQAAAFSYVLLWWPTFCWHATKWRLCRRLCSPWQLGEPREHASVLELVALVVRFVPAPGEATPGAGEDYAPLHQGDDLLWRDVDGRKIGMGAAPTNGPT